MYSDLETMSKRLLSGYYSSVRLFVADMKRILDNCKQYNEKNTDYFRCAITLEKVFGSKLKECNLGFET